MSKTTSRFVMCFKRFFLMFGVRRRMKMVKIHCKYGGILNISTFELGTKSIEKEFKKPLEDDAKINAKALQNRFKN